MSTTTKLETITAKRVQITSLCDPNWKWYRTDIFIDGKLAGHVLGRDVTMLGRNDSWVDVQLPNVDRDKIKMWKAARERFPQTPNRKQGQAFGMIIRA